MDQLNHTCYNNKTQLITLNKHSMARPHLPLRLGCQSSRTRHFYWQSSTERSRPAALLRPVTVTHLSQQSAFTASHGVLPHPGILSIKDSTLLTPVVPPIKSSVRENDSVSRCRPSLSRKGKFSPEATFPRANSHTQLLSSITKLP